MPAQGLNTPYMPRADGVLIKSAPQKLALQGKMARIPFIIGNVKDEGTLFSMGSLNTTYASSPLLVLHLLRET